MAATKKLGRGTTQNKPITQNATVGGSEIRRSPLDIINIPIMYDSFRNIPGGYLGFLNHQQYGDMIPNLKKLLAGPRWLHMIRLHAGALFPGAVSIPQSLSWEFSKGTLLTPPSSPK